VRLLLVIPLLAACDPAAPAATGTIQLSPEAIGTRHFLRIRQFPEGTGRWGARRPGEAPDCDRYVRDTAVELQPGQASAGYDFTGPLGPCSRGDWHVVAWLADSATAAAPVAGDRYGIASFKVATCGSATSFCGVTTHVDVTIDQAVD
jgi:hypothetical protein